MDKHLNQRSQNDPDGIILQIENLQKWFGEFQVLKDISLSVARGEVVCIIGPSGSGKSTLLRTINHLEPYDSGKILLNKQLVGYTERNGQVIAQKESLVALGRRDIGMVFQDFSLFWHMTLLDNVTLGPRSVLGISKKEAEERACELLKRVGLIDRLHAYPQSLSGGQQQRGAIARALAMQPSVILFDEPTSALDPEMTKEVVGTVEALARDGITMIIVSHEISFVRKVASRVIMMQDGQIIEDLADPHNATPGSDSRIAAYLRSANE